jgi:hypothetical protein
MRKISKVVHNTNNWTRVSGVAQTGIFVTESKRKNYYFGLEEWNNCEVLRKHKLAYLDSFRSFPRFDYFESIELINFNNQTVYHIGRLEGVKRIICREIPEIKNKLINDNWLKIVEHDFHQINDLRTIESHSEYMQCWNSEDIVAPINQGFILNVKYDRFTLFDQPRNLSVIDGGINNLKRLILLYEFKKEHQNIFRP